MKYNKYLRMIYNNAIYFFVALGFLVIASEISSSALYILALLMIGFVVFNN